MKFLKLIFALTVSTQSIFSWEQCRNCEIIIEKKYLEFQANLCREPYKSQLLRILASEATFAPNLNVETECLKEMEKIQIEVFRNIDSCIIEEAKKAGRNLSPEEIKAIKDARLAKFQNHFREIFIQHNSTKRIINKNFYCPICFFAFLVQDQAKESHLQILNSTKINFGFINQTNYKLGHCNIFSFANQEEVENFKSYCLSIYPSPNYIILNFHHENMFDFMQKLIMYFCGTIIFAPMDQKAFWVGPEYPKTLSSMQTWHHMTFSPTTYPEATSTPEQLSRTATFPVDTTPFNPLALTRQNAIVGIDCSAPSSTCKAPDSPYSAVPQCTEEVCFSCGS